MSDKKLTNNEINRALSRLQGHEEKPCYFDPVSNSAQNVELRDEYKVEINYFHKRVIIYNHDTGQTWRVEYEDESQINRAVLECILESVK